MKKYRIAAIQGDGIRKEVPPERIRVIDAATRKAGIHFEWQQFPWNCAYYKETGRMMPEDGLDQIRNDDTIFSGAVGFPGAPDHISLWGLTKDVGSSASTKEVGKAIAAAT
jgi:tartrate dehydrogenase/decarboxylase / D-malate dehydrogenase